MRKMMLAMLASATFGGVVGAISRRTRLALAGFLVTTVLAGCGSSSSSTESTTASAPSASATSSPPTTGSLTTSTAAPDTTAATPPGPPVRIGQTVMLSYGSVIGGDPDTQLEVTVHKVFPIQASGYAHLMAPEPLPYGVDITIKESRFEHQHV